MGLLNGGFNLGVLGKIGGKKVGSTSVTSSSAGKPYPDVLLETDLTTGTTLLNTTAFTTLGAGYTVPFNQQVSIGYGVASEPMNAGYAYMQIADNAGGIFYGKIRVIITDYNDIAKGVMFSGDLKTLNGDLNDKNKKIMIPEQTGTVANFNDVIKLQVQAVTASTYSTVNTNTVIRLPITRRYLQ